MGCLSNYAENKLLDHVLKTGAYSRPAHLYMALCTADPTDAGTGDSITEPSGGAYAREICDDWDSAAARATANSALIEFAAATAGWGTITHFAICDALTSGNMLAHGALDTPVEIETSDVFSLAIGDADISVNANGASNYLANALLDHLLEGTAFSQPTSIFVALTTAAIADSDTGSTITEPSDTYARQEVNTWDAASGGASENTNAISFPKASSGYGTCTDFALCDDLTGGNLLIHGDLTAEKNFAANYTPRANAGDLDITLD